MNTFMALADPTRLQIFELIARGETNVGEIVKQFSFKAPTISQHLRVLRQANLVNVRIEGQQRFYTIDKAGLKDMETWLKSMDHQWSSHLDALEETKE